MFKYLWAWLVSLGQAGQIPSSVTDNYDALLSTTLRNYQPKLKDNVTRGNKFIAWLDSKGRMRKVGGGHQIAEPLMHQQNSAADIYRGYGTLDTTPQDGITTAFFDWAQLSVPITISRLEERQNSGKAKILDLLQAKTMQSEVSLKELLNNCIVAGKITAGSAQERIVARTGRLDSGASGPLPIGAIIDVSASSRSVSIGNINGATYSFWRNQATASTATSFVGLKNEMDQVYNNCTKGTAGAPDLLLGGQEAWETYWLALQNNERYIRSDKATVDILGGSDALAFRSSAFIWDEVVPMLSTGLKDVSGSGTSFNPVDSIGTATHTTIYFINSQAM